MSEFGIRFNTSAGFRQIDTRHIVPQLIGRIDLASCSYVDQTESDGVQPGWIRRSYSFTIPSAILSRPYVMFFSIPSSGQEAYSYVGSVMYKPGATFTAPVLYFFALDYVTKSSASWGVRAKRPDGSVTYDSGNDHLNLSFIYGGVNFNVSHDDSLRASSGIVASVGVPPKGMPAMPAISAPTFDRYTEYGTRFEGVGTERCYQFYRSYGGNLQAVMLRNSYTLNETNPPSSNYVRTSTTNPNNQTILLVDRYIYD